MNTMLRSFLIFYGVIMLVCGLGGLVALMLGGGPLGKIVVFECVCWAWCLVCFTAVRS